MPSLSLVEGWHAPAGRQTCEPRPLAQARQIRPAAPVGARKPGTRPTDRLAGQPERRQPNRRSGRDPGPDPTPAPPQNHGSRAGSTIHILPAEYLRLSRWAETSEYHARSSSYVPSQRSGGSGITGGHGFALRQTCLPAAAHPRSNATPADGSERTSPFRRGLRNSRSPTPQILRVQCETGELRSRHAEHRDRCTRTETDTHDIASGGAPRPAGGSAAARSAGPSPPCTGIRRFRSGSCGV